MDFVLRPLRHHQRSVRIVGVDTPLDAGDEVRASIVVKVARIGVRTVIRDLDRFAKTFHRLRRCKLRVCRSPHVSQQIDAPALQRPMVSPCDAIDQIDETVLIPVNRTKLLRPMSGPLHNGIIDRCALLELKRSCLMQHQ